MGIQPPDLQFVCALLAVITYRVKAGPDPEPAFGCSGRPRACCWAAERDPNWPFGPEAVSPAANSASVVYWAPRSLPKPNPPFSRFRGAVHLAAPGPKRLAALASALARSKAASQPRPASPVPDCGEKFTAHPGDVNPEIVTIRAHLARL